MLEKQGNTSGEGGALFWGDKKDLHFVIRRERAGIKKLNFPEEKGTTCRGRAQRRKVDEAKAQVKGLAFNERGTLPPRREGWRGRKLERQANFGGVGQGTELIHA